MDMNWVERSGVLQACGARNAVPAERARDEVAPSVMSESSSETPLRCSARTRGARRFVRLMLLCASVLLGQQAWAAGCKTMNGYPKVYNLTLPGSSTMIPRDAPVGTTLAVVNGPMLTAGSSSNTATWFAECNTPTGSLNLVLTSTPWPLASPGIYSTNVAGVGVKMVRASVPVPGSVAYTPSSFPGNIGAPYGWYWYANPVFVYTFVKTGPISGGTVTSADIPTMAFNLDGTATVFTSTNSGKITFTAGACVTPDVQVPLDAASVKAFTGVGSTTGAKSFNIAVNSCPPGLTSVSYQLDAASGITVVNASQGVIGLGNSATAKGIGLQIKDNSNNPVSFGSMHATTGYNRTNGGNFTIPLKAFYYQTASTLSAGSVVSQAVFTMSYQ
ncbi:fimbrial protein [Dyella telluris]|uniref:Type 1 fimbrial protein n=1 Tax=Dyella telluris TaxID=2763498 RepID=A0A7G8Q0P9_9GAMM|nr:fimbrial protein [Dyella telluris]QNK00357.1 type 1 fimbrial protein [Dyella telluris]